MQKNLITNAILLSSGYGFDFGGISLSNVERIEVLRGEQSALWGSEAKGA